MAEKSIQAVLFELGLGTISQRFIEHKINFDLAKKLSDEELSALGVGTIGDRIRLKEKLNSQNTELPVAHSISSPQASGSTSGSTPRSLLDRIRRERSLLFSSGSGKSNIAKNLPRNQKKSKEKTWTGTFICMADKSQGRVPSVSEKEVLIKAQLGFKRIQFCLEDKEEDVLAKISENETGFYQLQGIGGFELLRCRQNCRELELVDCPWTVRDLKATLGSQGKIYLRPIQINLSTQSTVQSTHIEKREACKSCGDSFSIHELRKHVKLCHEKDLSNESDSELYDPHITETNVEETDEIQIEKIPDNIMENMEQVESSNNNSGSSVNRNNETIIESIIVSSTYQSSLDGKEVNDVIPIDDVFLQSRDDSSSAINVDPVDNLMTDESNIITLINNCLNYLIENSINDPVDILRYLQKNIVTGRELEISSIETPTDGDTNFISVNRQELIETAFDEVGALTDLRPTLEVQFYGENAVDSGGPRKEFFRLILREIKEKYFEPVRPFAKMEDYETIGKILALSMLQNGKIPQFLDFSLVDELFESSSPSLVVLNLRKGLDSLGLYKIGSSLPQFRHLFNTKPPILTLKGAITMLKPNFSEPGTNRRSLQTRVYSVFTKYLREVSSGRRENISLHSILMFATGADEEPILGFAVGPEICFSESETYNSFLPTSNTCINRLTLPIPSAEKDLPTNEILFHLYDLAFANTYYGLS
ncbi:uncharacterized protein LOC134684725 [Mytilus trossulus]|uniref:uncharacterized protein LOC134684725 n=1 Tax=Mytilus trossulus TaxID=6551 RepID=UPI003004244D